MKKAFTLIEILIGVLILLLLMGGIFSILNIGNMDWYLEEGLLNLHRQARQAMHGMIREVRQSQNSNIAISQGGARIIFIIPQDISQSTITHYAPIDYYLTGSQLIREHPAGTTAVLANNVNSIDFCLWDGTDCCDFLSEDCSSLNELQISLNAQKVVRQRTLTFSVVEKVRLRNE